MSQTAYQTICLHCKEPFLPDSRNRARQHFCYKPACRKARKAKSHHLWLAKNPNYFKGDWNVTRVQEWRQVHPGYSRRSKGRPKPGAASSVKGTHPTSVPPLQDRVSSLQDFITHNPLIIGLIAHIFGCTLQDDIETHMRRLIMAGMEIHRSLALGELRLKVPLTPEARQAKPAFQNTDSDPPLKTPSSLNPEV